MQEKQVALAGSFCWNESCPDYGQVGKGNIRKSGRTDKGLQRYPCKTCKKTWTETKGTMFYRCHHNEQTIVAGQRLAVPASGQTTTRQPARTCPDPGRLWRSRRGESELGISHGVCRTDPPDLKTDEWATGSQNPLVFKRALPRFQPRAVGRTPSTISRVPGSTLRLQVGPDPSQPRWLPRTPAQAAGLTDHLWTVKELLTTALVPLAINT
jgi:hypothetical protein